MSWHIHQSTSVFDSDGYGWSTDNPESPYEIIDNTLKTKDEVQIAERIREEIESIAHDYFNCGAWDSEWWDAWKEKVSELI